MEKFIYRFLRMEFMTITIIFKIMSLVVCMYVSMYVWKTKKDISIKFVNWDWIDLV